MDVEKNKKRNNENELTKMRAKIDEYSKLTELEAEEFSRLIASNKDFNSKEFLEFFEKLANRKMVDFGRDENGNLKYAPIVVDDKKQRDNDTTKQEEEESKKENKTDNQKDNNSDDEKKDKYEIVPVPEKHEIVPVPEKQEDKEEKANTIKIAYIGKINSYVVTDKDGKKVRFENEKVKGNKGKIELLKSYYDQKTIDYVFDGKDIKKAIKKCDANLISVLIEVDPTLNKAKNYINEVNKKEEDVNKENLGYEMTYNMRGMRAAADQTKLGFFQRFKMNRLAKKNKNVAKYIPDEKSHAWLAIPIVGAILAGAFAIGQTSCQKNKDKEEITTSDNEKETNTKNKEITKTTETTERTTTSQNEKETDESDKDNNSNNIEKAADEAVNGNQENNNSDFIVGSKVKLDEDVAYSEDSYGEGAQGKIGEVSWRPAGEYYVDRVALQYNGKVIYNVGTAGTNIDEIARKYAKANGINENEIKRIAHIAMTNNHGGATGWLKDDMQTIKNNITEVYGKDNNNNSEKNNIENTKTTDEIER